MLDIAQLDDPFARHEAPPAYSFEPCTGEQRLEITPRQGRAYTPLGNIIKKFGKVSLVLPEQEDGAQIPSYGRNDVIGGVFCFDDPSRITKVVIKIRGESETTSTEFGAKTTRLLDDAYTLWQSTDDSSCPHQIDFACPLPSTFIQDNEAKPLPPSFHFFDPGFYVKTYYRIFIEITRRRRSKFDFTSSVKRHSVPFKYCPRSRPNRPFEATPSFLYSVKASPEEWHQTTSTLKTWSTNQLTRDTLHCHFFVPSVRIFGLSDKIPFHIQLNGPISSLRGFFPPDALQRVASADTSLSVPSILSKSTGRKSHVQHHSVRVQILRQVVVVVDGRKVWRNSIIGEGVVYPLPPPLCRDRCLGTREDSLDWEGYVKCNDDAKVGSFSTGLFHVHHFLSLTLTPPDLRRSSFQVLNIHVPVRLVTDSYQEFG